MRARSPPDPFPVRGPPLRCAVSSPSGAYRHGGRGVNGLVGPCGIPGERKAGERSKYRARLYSYSTRPHAPFGGEGDSYSGKPAASVGLFSWFPLPESSMARDVATPCSSPARPSA